MRTERMTITELEQIRQRAEAATPGPWKSGGDKYGDSVVYAPLYRGFHNNGAEIAESLSERDALFISEAREAVPRLITEVETLILEKAAARRMLDELIGEMANAAEAGYALAPETVREDLEKIRKELIDHGE